MDRAAAVMRVAYAADLSPFAPAFLVQAIDRRLATSRHSDRQAYVEGLAADPIEADALIASLQMGYSELFRDRLAFAWLERVVLPALIERAVAAGRGEVRVWSAGCAQGQEAWSIAILLDEQLATMGHPLSYRVFATDITEPDLAKARAARYGVEAVGNVLVRHLRESFVRAGTSWTVAARLRDHVDFSRHDLLDAQTGSPPASIYGGFDLVLCCNVLLYYRPEAQRRILDRLFGSLAPGGYLLTSEAERQIVAATAGAHGVALAPAVFRMASRGN